MSISFYEEDLAYIHHVGFGGVAESASSAVLELLQEAGFERGQVVDLGCGGGTLAKALVDKGYDALGVDVSAAMIALSQQTAPKAQFACSSLYDIAIPPSIAVTAIGEGLTYIDPKRPMKQARMQLFQRILEALVPGGFFLFDVIAPDASQPMSYRTWTAGEDWAVLVDVKEDLEAHTVTRDIEIFRKTETLYRRSQEQHTVDILDPTEVTAMLEEVGYHATQLPSYGTHPLPPRRIAFLAKKRL